MIIPRKSKIKSNFQGKDCTIWFVRLNYSFLQDKFDSENSLEGKLQNAVPISFIFDSFLLYTKRIEC